MTPRVLPPSASIARRTEGSKKLFAPSAERNAHTICAALKTVAPEQGNALELASGTGQHIVTLAQATPNIRWQPTEVDRDRITSIQAYIDGTHCNNINKPVFLNATRSGWSSTIDPMSLVLLSNLLHLVSDKEVETLVAEVAASLLPGGRFFLYGPFKRSGELISLGDKEFDTNIRTSAPDAGYKDDQWIISHATDFGLLLDKTIEMPANNLALVFAKLE
jgi:SAM-dependent methyltransferase